MMRERVKGVSNMSNMSNQSGEPELTVPYLRWAATCQECERRVTFDDDEERDAWVSRHRKDREHRVVAHVVTVRRRATVDLSTVKPWVFEPDAEPDEEPAIDEVSDAQGLANVLNVFIGARIIESIKL